MSGLVYWTEPQFCTTRTGTGFVPWAGLARCLFAESAIPLEGIYLPSYSPPLTPFGQGFQRRACRV